MTANLESFFQMHKNKSWLAPVPPSGLTPLELTKWLFEQDSMGWLKIDIDINLNDWIEESAMVEPHYVHHRSSENYIDQKHQDWMSCCIHGTSITHTEADESADNDQFQWTELSAKTPKVTEFWKKFPVERFRRLRFMKLKSNGFIGIHNDRPSNMKLANLSELKVLDKSVAINVALIHPQGCDFVIENTGTVPFQPGDMFIINITKNHSVINRSDKDRIHVIAEAVIGNKINEFSDLIYRSYKKQHGYN